MLWNLSILIVLYYFMQKHPWHPPKHPFGCEVIHVTLVLIEIFTSFFFLIILFFQDKSFGNDNVSVSTVVSKQMGELMPTHPPTGWQNVTTGNFGSNWDIH